jgi:uncharacterized membrane-anchored protein YhcB (DUF1043 family)
VFSLSTLVFTGFFFLLCGTALGAFLLHIFRSNIYSRELEERLNEAESSLQNYQRDVAESFSQTSQHISDMTRCYREMHEHLASSALKLATPDISRKILESANSLGEAKTSYMNTQHIEPPRDWAPKPVGAKGALAEDYGLRDEEHAMVRPTETPEDFDFDGASAKRY